MSVSGALLGDGDDRGQVSLYLWCKEKSKLSIVIGSGREALYTGKCTVKRCSNWKGKDDRKAFFWKIKPYIAFVNLRPIFRRLGYTMEPSINAAELSKKTSPAAKSRARIFKRLRSPGIDPKESIPPAWGRYVKYNCCTGPPGWESIPGLLRRFTNTVSGLLYIRIRWLSVLKLKIVEHIKTAQVKDTHYI